MKTLLKKQLPGILAAGLVALAVGAASAPASASVASASGLTKSQQKKKKKELKKCNKKSSSKKKSKCKKQVNKKYKKLAKKNNGSSTTKGKTVTVQVEDNYYAPADVDLKVNDSIKWSWSGVKGYEAHNVTLTTGPAGVDRYSYVSQTSAITSYTFTRQFTKPGNYDFVCTLHTGMEMLVKVSK